MMRLLSERDPYKDRIFVTLMAAYTAFVILIGPNFVEPTQNVNVVIEEQQTYIDSANRNHDSGWCPENS